MSDHILTLNAGSSSLKFAVFQRSADNLVQMAHGQIEGLGATTRFSVDAPTAKKETWEPGEGPADHAQATAYILEWFNSSFANAQIVAVGHRIVHGGPMYDEPVVLNPDILNKLNKYETLAPLHQPHNLAGIKAAIKAFPDAAQVGCFDTSFHRNHPWVNDTFALPRKYYEEGVRRYGFHGLSYEFVVSELNRISPQHYKGRCIVAHLGNGASMCAIRDGQSIASTMGFSALDGLPMGTRCGQLDPGVLLYLMTEHNMDATALSDLLYKDSGLKGLSGISQDMRELQASANPDAAGAIDYFVFRIRREIGAMVAVLGGLDALIFCGGIGEHAAQIRERICAGFDWLGIEVDTYRNQNNEQIISADHARCRTFVIKTDEERMIAKHTARLISAAA